MKYYIYAKFIGSLMPETKLSINNCLIYKCNLRVEDDRPNIPVRIKESESHCMKKGVSNYIYQSQTPISIRTFESEYIITTEVSDLSLRDSLNEAFERFANTAVALSLSSYNTKEKNKVYDFEILGVFMKKKKEMIRLKMPDLLISGKNFFPKKYPQKFISRAKDYVKSKDLTFQKGMLYHQRVLIIKNLGFFNDAEIFLDLFKCIELICWQIAKQEKRFGLTKKDFGQLGTKKIIEKASMKLKISKKKINKAKFYWDQRNKGDIAHKNLYFNYFSKMSPVAIINLEELEDISKEYLIRYKKYYM